MNDQFKPDVLYIAQQILEHYEQLHQALDRDDPEAAERHFQEMAVRCQGLEHYVRVLGRYRDA